MEQGIFVNNHPILLPPVPKDTAEQAGSLFAEQHRYIRLGKNINRILFDLSKSGVDFSRDLSAPVFFRYALITCLQHAEGLTDRQSVQAMDERVDFKFALHLPLDYPRFEPARLCGFRRHLYHNSARLQLFQALLCQLVDWGFLAEDGGEALVAGDVLRLVCTNSRLDTVLEAFFQVLETLAVTDADWLRQITLPHWYDRYNAKARAGLQQASSKNRHRLGTTIGKDIEYLLVQIEQIDRPSLTSLPEVQLLRQVSLDQFERFVAPDLKKNLIRFRPAGCSSCIGNLG